MQKYQRKYMTFFGYLGLNSLGWNFVVKFKKKVDWLNLLGAVSWLSHPAREHDQGFSSYKHNWYPVWVRETFVGGHGVIQSSEFRFI